MLLLWKKERSIIVFWCLEEEAKFPELIGNIRVSIFQKLREPSFFF